MIILSLKNQVLIAKSQRLLPATPRKTAAATKATLGAREVMITVGEINLEVKKVKEKPEVTNLIMGSEVPDIEALIMATGLEVEIKIIASAEMMVMGVQHVQLVRPTADITTAG